MAAASKENNGYFKISFPVKALATLCVMVPSAVMVYSTQAQPEVAVATAVATVERALLIHAQDPHRGTATQTDMQRVQFVQTELDKDFAELRDIVKDLAEQTAEMQRSNQETQRSNNALVFELQILRGLSP